MSSSRNLRIFEYPYQSNSVHPKNLFRNRRSPDPRISMSERTRYIEIVGKVLIFLLKQQLESTIGSEWFMNLSSRLKF